MTDTHTNNTGIRQALTKTVQRNCDIADARYAGEYTLCVYLLKMREFYRWEQGIGFNEPMDREEIGNWISTREAEWEQLEDLDFEPLVIEGREYDIFDIEAVNDVLLPHGLVYSSGLGNCARPHFFLAELESRQINDKGTIHISGIELARDLTAPPAMSREQQIFLRRQSLQRMIWEKIEEWRLKQQDTPIGRTLAHYDISTDINAAIEAMAEHQLNTLLLHETGEVEAGRLLGETWHDMLMQLPHSQAEMKARAVRDLLADCLVTLPQLVSSGEPSAIHFYFSGHIGMRKVLFPMLEKAYQYWHQTHDTEMLLNTIHKGLQHWQQVASHMLETWSREPDKPQEKLGKLLESAIL